MKLAITAALTVVITAAAVVGILAAAGMLVLTRPPAEIVEACRAFIPAFQDAMASATRDNERILQTELAHPVRPSDHWKAKHQAALEAAALRVQKMQGEWSGVAWQLVHAASAMQPENLIGAVDKENALSGAHAACLGR
ncbi:hypothetical protein EDD27_3604 [Nonomuraea polychroma]|uniref:Uncharacterized protein n=1 Tax=Nonomuraea polychroma TaxID=46176 RepID=A0A438M5P8_9ACTN|nr:hypothetical protein [Nonomuraea polychroma]RVX41135.1 hypothetical protein EDD27_3604 [Nonomuraea polychroma]